MQTDDVNFSHDKLINVLTKMLRAEIIVKDFSVSKLHGGTVGDVSLISGDAKTDCGKILPFKVVLKTQKKWERYNDPGSWRREYDFYKSGFENFFDGKLRWPECFHAEMNEAEDQWQAWTEYAEGATGNDLTVEMCAKAAYELGKLQGRLYARKPDILKNFANLSGVDAVKQYYQYYRSWHEVYDYVRAADYITPSCTFNVCHPELAKGLEDSSPAAQNDNCTFSVCHPELAKGLEDSSPAAQNDNYTLHNDACPLPKHICEMIIETDKNSESLWEKIETLPVVLCHKDFWITNIIYTDEKIFLLDWDTTGFGYLGEDVAQLISDDIDAEKMHEYCRACVPAYLKGFNEHSGIPQVNDLHLRDRIIMSLGYRYVENYKFAETEEERETSLNLLQKIYEL